MMNNSIDFYIDTEFNNVDEFDCGFEIFNTYLKEHIPDDNAVIHYVIDADGDKLIAYFSLSASAVLIGNSANFSSVPAIELKMFAIDKNYRKLNLSERLINAIKLTVYEYSIEYVGAKVMTLYAVPVDKVVQLYEKCGFQQFPSAFVSFNNSFNEGCIPMFRVISKDI